MYAVEKQTEDQGHVSGVLNGGVFLEKRSYKRICKIRSGELARQHELAESKRRHAVIQLRSSKECL